MTAAAPIFTELYDRIKTASTLKQIFGRLRRAVGPFKVTQAHWKGLPEYVSENKQSFYVLKINLRDKKRYDGKQAFVTIHFRERDFPKHRAEVSKRLGISSQIQETMLPLDEAELAEKLFDGHGKISHHSAWFPFREIEHHRKYAYRLEDGAVVNPYYSIFVISKGRWESLLTVRALERMGVPHILVVEPKEAKNYEDALKAGYDDGKPYKYCTLQVAPENFSERGQGSIPVRNYVWDLAIKTGKARHWVLDDNIRTFLRTNHNLSVPVETGAIFRAVEVFADRYENIALTGLQNKQFVLTKCKRPAFSLNTRIYSCTLIKNDLSLPTPEGDRWRGIYNEDSDLVIRALKAGWVTVLFSAFTAEKITTMTMKGGNTDDLYAGDGRLRMAKSLAAQHPDVARVTRRFNRWQHKVDYKKCVELEKAAKKGGCVLKLKSGITLSEGVNNFGMVRVNRATGQID